MVNLIIYSEKAIDRNYFIKLVSQQYNYSYFTPFLPCLTFYVFRIEKVINYEMKNSLIHQNF